MRLQDQNRLLNVTPKLLRSGKNPAKARELAV
jgi:hypothetical protein